MIRRELDGFCQNFDRFEDFIACVEDREKNTERLVVPGNAVKFVGIMPGNAVKVANDLNVDEELVDDTIRRTSGDYGTCLYLKKGRKKYLVGSSAFASGEYRIKLFGDGVWDLTNFPKTLAQAFTDLFSLKEKNVKIVVTDGKVRSIMSHVYAFVPMKDMFTQVVKEMAARFDDDYIVEEAYIDHRMSTLKILFPNGNQKITDLYRLPKTDNWMPGLVITTGDTGDHAVKIDPYFKSGGITNIIQKEKQNKKHVGDLSVERIIDDIPNVFLRYQDAVEKMVKLLSIEIKNPITVIQKALKELKYNKTAQEGMVDELKYFMAMTSDQVTAYDLYKILADYAKYINGTPDDKLAAQEMAGKAINLKYDKLD